MYSLIALTVIEVGLEKNIAYITLEKIMVLSVTIQGLNNCIRSYNSLHKVVAIQFILASSVNVDDMFDYIHSTENVDHLIAERTAYVKSQVVENLAEDKSDKNSNSTDSQIDADYISHVIGELIDSCQR